MKRSEGESPAEILSKAPMWREVEGSLNCCGNRP